MKIIYLLQLFLTIAPAYLVASQAPQKEETPYTCEQGNRFSAAAGRVKELLKKERYAQIKARQAQQISAAQAAAQAQAKNEVVAKTQQADEIWDEWNKKEQQKAAVAHTAAKPSNATYQLTVDGILRELGVND